MRVSGEWVETMCEEYVKDFFSLSTGKKLSTGKNLCFSKIFITPPPPPNNFTVVLLNIKVVYCTSILNRTTLDSSVLHKLPQNIVKPFLRVDFFTRVICVYAAVFICTLFFQKFES